MNEKERVTRIVTAAVLTALGVVLAALVHFPIFPQVPFLEYDPADIPVLLCSFLFGPAFGVLSTVVVALIQGLTVSAESGLYGILMHVIATSAYVLVSALVYRRRRTIGGAVLSLCLGTLAMVAVMLPANLFITPVFMGTTQETVVSLLPFILLFNLVKAVANGLVTFLLYKPLRRTLQKL